MNKEVMIDFGCDGDIYIRHKLSGHIEVFVNMTDSCISTEIELDEAKELRDLLDRYINAENDK